MDITERKLAEEALRRRRRIRTHQEGDYYGRADCLPGARGETTDCRAVTSQYLHSLAGARYPNVEEARAAAMRSAKDGMLRRKSSAGSACFSEGHSATELVDVNEVFER